MSARSRSSDWERAARQLGRKVQALRTERQLTQEQLAQLVGISRNQVQNIEHCRNNTKDATGKPGSGNPRLDTVFKLTDALGVDPMYLIDEGRERPQADETAPARSRASD